MSLQVNTKKINALLVFFSQNRKCDADFTCEETTIAPVMKSQLPLGPMFPALKQFVVTSNVSPGAIGSCLCYCPSNPFLLERLLYYNLSKCTWHDIIYCMTDDDSSSLPLIVCITVFTTCRERLNTCSFDNEGHNNAMNKRHRLCGGKRCKSSAWAK